MTKNTDGVDDEEISRNLQDLVQSNKESITSFNKRFSGVLKAYQIFYRLKNCWNL